MPRDSQHHRLQVHDAIAVAEVATWLEERVARAWLEQWGLHRQQLWRMRTAPRRTMRRDIYDAFLDALDALGEAAADSVVAAQRLKFENAVFGEDAWGRWLWYQRWTQRELRRFFRRRRGDGGEWAANRRGSKRSLTGIAAAIAAIRLGLNIGDLRDDDDRELRRFADLVESLQGKPAKALEEFGDWCDAEGVDERRAYLATVHILGPLVQSIDTGGIERRWEDLDVDERLTFVRAGIQREKLLLGSGDSLERARRADPAAWIARPEVRRSRA